MKIQDAADYLIYLSYRGESYSLTPLKLQKLLYYAQGWSYVWDNKTLFKGDFEPWQYGPVNKKIYDRFKKYKSNEIPELEGNLLDNAKTSDLETLESVWKMYGKYSANKLVAMTHKEDPWLDAVRVGNDIIDKESIKQYFQSKY